MGNCMETCMTWEGSDSEEAELEKHEEGDGFVEKSEMKMKVALTKKEVEWLILELRREQNGGNKSLEAVLAELQKRRASVVEQKWRPSLHSIVEGIEVVEKMDR